MKGTCTGAVFCSTEAYTKHTNYNHISNRFLSPANQRVTDTLIDTVFNDTSAVYTAKDIKRAAHRYYESRRRLGIEEMPDRQVCTYMYMYLCKFY